MAATSSKLARYYFKDGFLPPTVSLFFAGVVSTSRMNNVVSNGSKTPVELGLISGWRALSSLNPTRFHPVGESTGQVVVLVSAVRYIFDGARNDDGNEQKLFFFSYFLIGRMSSPTINQ